MAAITFSRATTTTQGSQMGLSASITVPNITASGATFTIPTISGTITSWTYNASTYPQAAYQTEASFYTSLKIAGASVQSFSFEKGYLYIGASSAWSSKGWTATSAGSTFNTGDYFSSSNPTTRSLAITLTRTFWYIQSDYGDPHQSSTTANGSGSATLTLDVPPTGTVSAMTYDTPYVYADLTTASVSVSDLAAYYGGSVTDVTLAIGAQTASRSDNGTLSIALNAAGTFTPTVTITDSRGQTAVTTLADITVKTYVPPTVSYTAERTTSTGTPDEEGNYATLDATFVFADAIASAIAPSVVLTNENGTQTTPVVTWYTTRASDGTLSGSVTWSSLSSGDTVYGLIPGVNTQYSYQIRVRPRDSEGTGTAIITTVGAAFYTVDFLAGGHGIAFGQPASQAGFYCNMNAHFLDTSSGVSIAGDLHLGSDIYSDNNDLTINSDVITLSKSSALFSTTEETTAELTISGLTNLSSQTLSISKAGYVPLGIVGVRCNYTSGQTGARNVYYYYLSSRTAGAGTVSYGVRNLDSASTKGTISFEILWVRADAT